jgi:3-dehydroquinate synthetase
VRLDGVDVGAVLAAVGLDKKRLGAGAVPFVLLEGPGAPRVGQPVPPDALRAAVEELLG